MDKPEDVVDELYVDEGEGEGGGVEDGIVVVGVEYVDKYVRLI